MNKLKTLLCAIFTLMLVNMSTAQSDSSNFAGPYIGFQLLGLGAEFDGKSNSSAGTSAAVEDSVPVGAAVATVGIELGYTIPIGSLFALDIGGQYLSGEAKMDHATSYDSGIESECAGNVSMTMDDHYTYYIAPTIILSDTSSLYLKAGLTHADVGVKGDITTPGNLSGTMWAIGTRTVLASGIFIRTEAGYTDYNGISAHGLGQGTVGKDLIDTGTTFSAEPTIVHGTVSLGFRF
jgi:hypothetical protein